MMAGGILAGQVEDRLPRSRRTESAIPEHGHDDCRPNERVRGEYPLQVELLQSVVEAAVVVREFGRLRPPPDDPYDYGTGIPDLYFLY